MENILSYLASHRYSLVTRYTVTVFITLIFTLLRVEMGERAGTYGFFVFIPAVFLASLLFDRGSGLLATALSTAALAYLIEPFDSFEVAQKHIIPLVFFVLECTGIAALCEALRHALERATRAEREKDLMFQELAHRTKNNLQMIASVLTLQARAQTEPAVRAAFDVAISRVQIIARAHERLQPGGPQGEVNLRDFLEDLCGTLGDTLRDLRPVAVRVEVEPIMTGPDKAVPLGLIVNELVTNAFKYAFPDGAQGAVEVSLRRVSEKEVRLSVEDNGIGCTASDEGLGTRLTRLLVQQLGGSIQREAGSPGCRVTARLSL
ncbi:MAG TPA: histidine kinase dimerization/phosphoacceptor domain -containing protein [Microvirga sp.]|nr:histidine kinase dimerization/phosphoacceptor domain -containing protein [Microvirga sp.]